MPYIAPQHREALNGLIDGLAARILEEAGASGGDGAFAGVLNYACTRLALQVVRRRFGALRYWQIALLTGVFQNLAQEFYRRVAAPYEDRQQAKNGDVDLYREYLAELDKD